MPKYDFFRERAKQNECCRIKYESAFIIDGSAATTIFHVRTNNKRQAALTIDEKEGPNTTLVFTDDLQSEQNLRKGDYFIWRDKYYFVYENCDIVREVGYIKQRAYQCNVDFVINNETYFGYYVSSLRSYVDTELEQKLNISDKEKPILILPFVDGIEVGLKLVISGKPYKIIDFDLITNDGICYASLERDFIDKSDNIAAQEDETDIESLVLKAGDIVTLSIEYGYFKTDVKVDVIKRTISEVQFVVPFGINQLIVYTKDKNKMDIKTEYKVV